MGCIDVCLEKKERKFGDEAAAGCLSSGSNQGEGMTTV